MNFSSGNWNLSQFLLFRTSSDSSRKWRLFLKRSERNFYFQWHVGWRSSKTFHSAQGTKCHGSARYVSLSSWQELVSITLALLWRFPRFQLLEVDSAVFVKMCPALLVLVDKRSGCVWRSISIDFLIPTSKKIHTYSTVQKTTWKCWLGKYWDKCKSHVNIVICKIRMDLDSTIILCIRRTWSYVQQAYSCSWRIALSGSWLQLFADLASSFLITGECTCPNTLFISNIYFPPPRFIKTELVH